jgi:hypothetical protein
MLQEVDHGPRTVDEEGDEILRMDLLLWAELLQHLGRRVSFETSFDR